MTDLWLTLGPILLSDVLNPVLFAYLVYAAGTRRPIANSSAALLGHTVAYVGAGIFLALGLEKISARLANPKPFDFLIEVVLGLALIWLAIASRKPRKKRSQAPAAELTWMTAFGYGAVINFVGIPFAVPYFAAIDQMLKANLSVSHTLGVLAVYNIAYALPFLVVPGLVLALGDRSRPVLARINDFLDRVSNFLLPILLALVGLALLADAVTFFASGESLF